MAKTPEEKRIAQAEAHRKWRQSEKGKAWRKNYYQKNFKKKPEVEKSEA